LVQTRDEFSVAFVTIEQDAFTGSDRTGIEVGEMSVRSGRW
jgi:hypothetical protein